jgi:DNA-binding transcriptional LysR family regulator
VNTSWDDLRMFLAVAEAQSMRAASRSLGVDPATVSRRMRDMQERLGVALLERHPTGWTLTAAGQDMLKVASRAHEEFEDLDRRIIGRDEQLSGVVRITASESVMSLMPAIVADLARAHPAICLELLVSEAMVDLQDRQADVAIRFSNSPPDALVGRSVSSVSLALYAAPTYIAAAENAADLGRQRWVDLAPPLDKTGTVLWRKRHFPQATIAVRVNSSRMMEEAIAAGLGIGVLACFMGDPNPGLERIGAPLTDLTSKLWVLTHADLRRTARVRAVLDVIYEQLIARKAFFEGQ